MFTQEEIAAICAEFEEICRGSGAFWSMVREDMQRYEASIELDNDGFRIRVNGEIMFEMLYYEQSYHFFRWIHESNSMVRRSELQKAIEIYDRVVGKLLGVAA
ncbi:MAG: hypothetical protein NTX72_01105 [Candidatus Uhrbacteria bacterium]|nr:hypothetical protein [Candidatus Uhrbacteria bacterium]